MTKILLAAALLGGTVATAAFASPPDPPHGGPCHVYWQPWIVDGVDKPTMICDY